MPTTLPPQIQTIVRIIGKFPTVLRTFLGFFGLFALLAFGLESDLGHMWAYMAIVSAYMIFGTLFHFFRFMHGRFGSTGVLTGVGMLTKGAQVGARHISQMSTGASGGPGISGNFHGGE